MDDGKERELPKHYPAGEEERIIEMWEREGIFSSDRYSPRFTVVGMPSSATEQPTISSVAGFVMADVYTRFLRHTGHSVLLPLLLHDSDAKNPWLAREKTTSALRRTGISYDRSYQAFTGDDEIVEMVQARIIDLYNKGRVSLEHRLHLHCYACARPVTWHETRSIARKTVIYSVKFGNVVAETPYPEFLPMVSAIASPPSMAKSGDAEFDGRKLPVIVWDVERPCAIDLSMPWHRKVAESSGITFNHVLSADGNYVSGIFKGLSVAEARQRALEWLASESLLAGQREGIVVERIHECGNPVHLYHSSQWFSGDVLLSGGTSIPFPWLVCRDCGKGFMGRPRVSSGQECRHCGSRNTVAEHMVNGEFARSVLVSTPCSISAYHARVSDSRGEYDRIAGVCDGRIFGSRGILGSDGREMAMELGNAVRPDSTMLRNGADPFRIASLLSAFQRRAVFRISHLQFGIRMVSKMWSIARFVQTCSGNEGNDIDRLADERVSIAADAIRKRIGEMGLGAALNELWHVIRFVSSIYIPMTRHRRDRAGKHARGILLKLTAISSPFMPFVSESIYNALFRDELMEKSISDVEWPSYSKNGYGDLERARMAVTFFRLGRRAKGLLGIPEREEIYEARISHEIGYELREVLAKALNARNILVGSEEWTVSEGGFRLWMA